MPPMCHRILKKENFKNKSADKEPILCICKKSASNQPAQLPAKYLVMSAQKYQRMKNKYNAKYVNLFVFVILIPFMRLIFIQCSRFSELI